MAQPESLSDFCSIGTPCPPNGWLHRLWARTWGEGHLGVVSYPVVRDESQNRISLDLPSNCLVMEECHLDEFRPFKVSKVYVRNSFVRLSRFIVAFYEGNEASATGTNFTNPFLEFKSEEQKVVIVTGTPGNGKTMFLYFLLRCRLHAKLPTILQLENREDGEFFLFSESGVCRFPEEPFPIDFARCLSRIMPDTWCLVDSNNLNYTPSGFLQASRLSIIQSASPRHERIHWAEKCSIDVRTYFMPPFTLEEAITARSLQSKYPSERQLQGWFNNYAPSARLAYRNAADTRIYEKVILPRLLSDIDGPNSVHALAKKVNSFKQDDLSHQIFVFFPSDNYIEYICTVPTRHLCMKLIESCCLEDEEQCKQSLRLFLSSKHLAAPAGYLMEQLIHALLPLGGAWPLLKLSTHDNKTNQHWSADDSSNVDKWLVIGFQNQPVLHIPSACPPLDSPRRGPLVVKWYDTLEKLADDCFYIPNPSNQPTFDLFYHSAGHVYVFQHTVTRAKHTVNHRGLKMMHQLGVLKVTYIGVVPTGRWPTFTIDNSAAKEYENLLDDRYLLQLEF